MKPEPRKRGRPRKNPLKPNQIKKDPIKRKNAAKYKIKGKEAASSNKSRLNKGKKGDRAYSK